MALATKGLEDFLHGFAEISTAINEPTSVPTLLKLVSKMACELLGFDFCGVFLPDKNGEILVVEGSHGFTSMYIDEVNAHHPIDLREGEAQAPSTRAFRTQRSVQVTNTNTDPTFAPWAEGARGQGFTSMIAVPLLASGVALGTLNGYSSGRREFTSDEVHLATMLANQAAIAIASSQLRASQARTIEDLQVLNRSLTQQHQLLSQGDEVHQRLTNVALREGGVTGVAEALSGLLGRSILVQEATGRWMASVLLDSEDFQLQRQTNDGLLPFTGGTPVGSGPDIFVDATASGEAWVVAPVWLSGDLAARIWAAGRTADLDSLDRRAIEHAATVLALELMRLRTAMEIEWRTAADIVRDLIHGNASVAAALLPRAAGLGHDLDRSHFVVIAQADANSDDLRPSVISIVRAVAATVDPRPLVATVGTNVVALWPATKPEEHVAAADAIRTRFRRARPGATISVTVTPPCQSLHGYPRAYRLGRGLAELAHERGVRDATLQIGDSGPLGLLLQIERAEELVAFSDKILGPLCAYDKRRSASLGQTVAAYFRNNLNTAATAAELHVHPNTVGLRIRRAEEILDLSLTDVDTTVHIGLALMCDEVIAVMGGSADH